MGGDHFEGLEKLTNEEYQLLVPEIIGQIQHLCLRVQPYVPLPEKNIHGDMDFMIILQKGIKQEQIIQTLKIDKFQINHNDTINSVYKNKQADFCFKDSQESFQMTKFYKSYSGIGAHLGLLLPSKQVKLSDSGLFALAYKEHIKFQFLIINSVEQILKFYGLDFQTYQKGFKTRKQLFQYLRKCVYLNQKKMKQTENKKRGKLTCFLRQYLLQEQSQIENVNYIEVNDPLKYTLNYFKKQQQFNKQFADLLGSIEKKQKLNEKFHGMHIMEYFGVPANQVNKIKKQFRNNFKDEKQYESYVNCTQTQEILKRISKQQNLKQATIEQKQQIKCRQKQYQQKANERGQKKQKQRKLRRQAQKLQKESSLISEVQQKIQNQQQQTQ